MKRTLEKKQVDFDKAMSELEQAELKRLEEVKKIKESEFQKQLKYNNEYDAGFYFSVVFNTRAERDKWLKERNIVLTEDFFVKAEDFNV